VTGGDGDFIDGEGALSRVEELGVPLVHLSGWLGTRALPRVESDYGRCAEMAAVEFKRLGLTKVVGREAHQNSLDRGCDRALKVAARRNELEYIGLSPSEGGDLTKQVAQIVDEIAKITGGCGLFLAHAGVAFSVVDGLLERGIRVPQDVSIIAIDKDAQLTLELTAVPLTGVVIDEWQQGYEAAAMVYRIMMGEEKRRVVRRVKPLALDRRESTGVVGSRDPVVAKVLHLIEKRWNRRLGVDDLAEAAGVSRRTLETKFRRATNPSVHVALTRRRMDEAKRLLRTGRRTIFEISEECRFSSAHYFSSAFKRETGETPGRYRKRLGDE